MTTEKPNFGSTKFPQRKRLLPIRCEHFARAEPGNIVLRVFTPVPAKHSKSPSDMQSMSENDPTGLSTKVGGHSKPYMQ